MLISLASTTHTAQDWLWQAMTSRLALSLTVILLVSIVGLVICARAVVRIARLQAAQRPVKVTGEEGTAVMEFALVFPFVLFFILLIAQTTFLMTGNLIVHYAAFAATRAAIVQVSSDYSFYGGESQNRINLSPGSFKYDAVRRAAVTALWPVSGPSRDGTVVGDDVAQQVAAVYTRYGKTAPNWTERLLANRFRYADENTQVFFYALTRTDDADEPLNLSRLAGSHHYGPRDPVTVEVVHRFYLSVPWVGPFFRDGDLDSGGGSYTEINAQYTLTNEGIIVALPEKPEIDRRP